MMKMICPSCGLANADNAITCVNCGEDLSAASRRRGGRICPGCRTENDGEARLCLNCGTPSSKSSTSKPRKHARHTAATSKKKKHQTYTRKAWHESPATLTVAGFSIVFVVVPHGNRRQQKIASVPNLSASAVVDPAIEPSFDNVVDRFTRGCGRCTEPLSECECPTAEKEESTVERDLERGEKPAGVMNAVYRTYGHLAKGSNEEAASWTGGNYVPGSLSLPK